MQVIVRTMQQTLTKNEAYPKDWAWLEEIVTQLKALKDPHSVYIPAPGGYLIEAVATLNLVHKDGDFIGRLTFCDSKKELKHAYLVEIYQGSRNYAIVLRPGIKHNPRLMPSSMKVCITPDEVVQIVVDSLKVGAPFRKIVSYNK